MTTRLFADDLLVSEGTGAATIPIVAAVSALPPVGYAEIVASIASIASSRPDPAPARTSTSSPRPRRTRSRSSAARGDHRPQPAEPPLIMRDTVFCLIGDADHDAIRASITSMVERVAEGVGVPRSRGRRALPAYAGNLDIMTSAAVRVAESIARRSTPEAAR